MYMKRKCFFCEKEYEGTDKLISAPDIFCSSECFKSHARIMNVIRILFIKKSKSLKTRKQQLIKILNIRKKKKEHLLIENKMYRIKYIRYKEFDIEREWYNTISVIDYINMLQNDVCTYCNGIADGGLDRIDNNKGHSKDNVVLCCYLCNVTRNNKFTHDEFKIIGKAIQQIKESRKFT